MKAFTFAVTIAGVLYFISVLVFLHVVRKDTNPWSSPISEYVIGAHGRWMTSVLWVWCISSIVFAVGIYTAMEQSASVILGTVLLIIFGLGLAFAAQFRMDVPFPPKRFHPSEFSTAGLLHISGATVSSICFPVAAIIISLGLGKDERWPHLRTTFFVMAMVCGCATAVFFMVKIQYFGIAQRVFVATDLMWQVSVAVAFLADRNPSQA